MFFGLKKNKCGGVTFVIVVLYFLFQKKNLMRKIEIEKKKKSIVFSLFEFNKSVWVNVCSGGV